MPGALAATRTRTRSKTAVAAGEDGGSGRCSSDLVERASGLGLVAGRSANEPKTATRFGAGRLEVRLDIRGLLSVVVKESAPTRLEKPERR
jgi:hypothetical protein